jgi:hypothetical protein
MGMRNFDGPLPRPSVLRYAPTALDDLLLPQIDESVRTQYLIRDAERRGNIERARELQASKSKRLVAKEKGRTSATCYWFRR